MEQSNTYSKKSFWIITALGLLISAFISFCLYQSLNWVLQNLSNSLGSEIVLEKVSFVNEQALIAVEYFYKALIPAIGCVVLVFAWLLWLILKSIVPSSSVDQKRDDRSSSNKEKKDFLDRKLEQDRKRRLFLHALSVLQRDGRLLDFFDENLSEYEDEQIGAAVRSIQEDCKKTIHKYINPKSVVNKDEGDEVTIEEGFDIDSIKLTGNVSGEPPFKGIVKHRGWKAGKSEIPKLSDIKDAAIIVPAEVEIQ